MAGTAPEPENELLRAQLAAATQELEIWQNLQVMQARLNVALAKKKIEDAQKAKADRRTQ